MLKAALAAALVVASPIYDDQRQPVSYPLVKKVVCQQGTGTAFRVGPTTFLSVAHVSGLDDCLIDGNPITVKEQDNANDFAIIEAGPPKAGALKINCGGFETMHWYWSVGFAGGYPGQTAVAVAASAFRDEVGKRTMFGLHDFIPGMSGGPVLDSNGEVVGVVNSHIALWRISFSRELKDTSVCR